METTALPATVVNEGIAVTLVALANPIAAPPVISKETPEGVPDNAIAEAVMPLQYVWFAGAATVGVGLTVI